MKVKCQLCGATLKKLINQIVSAETQEAFAIYKCKNCGLQQTLPLPSDMTKYYPSEYYGNRHGITNKLCVQRRLARINKIFKEKTGKLLDIGCGDASFLLAAQRQGWRVYGTELGSNILNHVSVNIKTSLNEISSESPFDCITLWHSLEHFADPQSVIKQVSELLSPNGILFIAVPNAGGWQSRLFGRHWLHRDTPRHLFHFDQSSLSHLLAQRGFKTVHTWHHEFEYDLIGWVQGVLNLFSKVPNVFFNLVNNRKTTLNYFQRIIHLFLGITLSILMLPLVPFAALAKQGGTIIVVAQRNE